MIQHPAQHCCNLPFVCDPAANAVAFGGAGEGVCLTPEPWRGVISDAAWLCSPAIIQLCIKASYTPLPYFSD